MGKTCMTQLGLNTEYNALKKRKKENKKYLLKLKTFDITMSTYLS